MADLSPLQKMGYMAMLGACSGNEAHQYSYIAFGHFDRLIQEVSITDTGGGLDIPLSEAASKVYSAMQRVSSWRALCNLVFALRPNERLYLERAAHYCGSVGIPLEPLLLPSDEECVALMLHAKAVVEKVFIELQCDSVVIDRRCDLDQLCHTVNNTILMSHYIHTKGHHSEWPKGAFDVWVMLSSPSSSSMVSHTTTTKLMDDFEDYNNKQHGATGCHLF